MRTIGVIIGARAARRPEACSPSTRSFRRGVAGTPNQRGNRSIGKGMLSGFTEQFRGRSDVGDGPEMLSPHRIEVRWLQSEFCDDGILQGACIVRLLALT